MQSKYRCKICGKSFRSAAGLKQHMKDRHPGRYYSTRLGISVAVIAIVLVAIFLFGIGGVITSPQTTTPTIMITTGEMATKTSTPSTATKETTPAGPKALDFSLPLVNKFGLTGGTLKLSDFEGKPVFLEFISPTCPHCLKMFSVVKRLYSKYGDKIVFVTVSTPKIETLTKVLKEHDADWYVVLDEELKVFNEYGVKGVPMFFVLDKSHRIAESFVGEKTEEMLEAAIWDVI